MTIRKYYEDELAYLRELGDSFSRANPDIAGLLSKRASDPDVERLMEGFAFLTSRLRARLDEGLPELTQGMLSLLWPHYLRPIPAMSIVAFEPPPDGTLVTIRGHAALAARPVEGVACQFRVCYDQPLVPATVTDASLDERSATAQLTVTLGMLGQVQAGAVAAGGVRFFLNDDRDGRLGARLLHALLTEVSEIELTDGTQRAVLPGDALRHGGFGLHEGVLPWPGNAFPGYRILQEYLVFPERFLFLDLPPAPSAAALRGDTLQIIFRMRRRPDLPSRIRRETIHLNCVPVINLTTSTAQPIRPERDRLEYRLLPATNAGPLASVHSVSGVEGAMQGKAERLEYTPFDSLQHVLGGKGAFYRLRLRPAVARRGIETWIAFVDSQDRAVVPRVDTISAQILSSDGALAELVPIGGIDRPGLGIPAGVRMSNLTRVTAELPPPLSGDLLWRLTAGMARSMRPLTDIVELRSLITAYDFRALGDDQARQRLGLLLDGLLQIERAGFDTLVKGIPTRGWQMTLTVAESGFGGPDGAFLFGAVLNAFLGIYANVNTCMRLVMEGEETKFRYAWPQHAGEVPNL